tara:strand:+ start:145 stop:501 length:357 start_codon:yes stop_codon:yes gene_type:complete
MKHPRIIFFFVAILVNFWAARYYKLEITAIEILTIHIFLGILFFSTTLLQRKLLMNNKTSPMIALVVNFLRILLCILFLFTTLFMPQKAEATYIYNFFVIYFFILFLDIFLKWKALKN